MSFCLPRANLERSSHQCRCPITATDLLPSERDHGRDLGIVNTAAVLGQLLGPVIGALLVAAVGGFWLVFTLAAVLSVVGGLLTALAREPVGRPVESPCG